MTALNFGQISVISRKRYKIETCFQWKTNTRKPYVAYRLASACNVSTTTTTTLLRLYSKAGFSRCEQASGSLDTAALLSFLFFLSALSKRFQWLWTRQLATSVSAKCFYQLRQLRRVRRSLDHDSATILVHTFVTSRIDYGNSLFANAPKMWTDKLQRVMNAAARVISGTRKFDRGLTRFVRDDLHWLDVPQRHHV